MALTISEAGAVNILLRWMLDLPAVPAGETPAVEDAQLAAALLADHARRTLKAGLDSDDVAAHWAAADPLR